MNQPFTVSGLDSTIFWAASAVISIVVTLSDFWVGGFLVDFRGGLTFGAVEVGAVGLVSSVTSRGSVCDDCEAV